MGMGQKRCLKLVMKQQCWHVTMHLHMNAGGLDRLVQGREIFQLSGLEQIACPVFLISQIVRILVFMRLRKIRASINDDYRLEVSLQRSRFSAMSSISNAFSCNSAYYIGHSCHEL